MSKYSRVIDFQCRYLFQRSWIITFLILYISSCKNLNVDEQFQYIEKNQLYLTGITIEYPKEGTVFPPEFPSPQFSRKDTLNPSAKWYIRLSTKNGKELHRETVDLSIWRPDSVVWQNIKTAVETEPVFFTIIGNQKGIRGSKYSSGRISFSFSEDSVGAPIFYRAVPLPFGYAVKHVDEIEWYSGSIDGGKPRKILDKIPLCANCHSFSKNGLVAMDIDYANDKGSYIIIPAKDTVHLTFDKIITWSDYKREDREYTYGLLSQISPDGRYVLSTVKDRSVFVAVDNPEYSQLFFPIKGIIAVYDREAKKFYKLQGASDPRYVQSNPNWSPDCSKVLFARAERYSSPKIESTSSVLLNIEDVQEFTLRQKEFKYDLYCVPFNDGKGGQAMPVPGASNNKKSNFFARYSPDGKWIVFCQAENFMLLQQDSKLYIMPANGGTPRLMNCNTDNMNSWHSWSPNSKWLVFSSKIRGPYTQLYLTHIDENGIDSPPVFLENLAFNSRAANIPEFLNPRVSGMKKMLDDFSRNAIYYTRLAKVSQAENRYKDALNFVEDAIKTDSSFYDAYKERISINSILGNSKSTNDLYYRKTAKELIERQIQQNPEDKSLYIKRGHLRLMNDDFEGALQDGIHVLKINTNDYDAYVLMRTICEKMGQPEKAIRYQKKILQFQPGDMIQIYNLAYLYQKINQPDQALKLLNDLIVKDPANAKFYILRAGLMLMKGDLSAAKNDFNRAILINPGNYFAYRERGTFYMKTSSPEMARNDLNHAIKLLGEDIQKNPQNAPLCFLRGEIMEQAGNIQDALNEYEKYLQTWPPNISVLKNKAEAHFSQKQWQKAIESYTMIIDNFPEETEIFFNRSRAYVQSGNLEKALEDLNTVIRFYPEEYRYYYVRSMIKKQLGDNAGSNNDLKTTAEFLKEIKTKRKLTRKEQDLLSSILNY